MDDMERAWDVYAAEQKKVAPIFPIVAQRDAFVKGYAAGAEQARKEANNSYRDAANEAIADARRPLVEALRRIVAHEGSGTIAESIAYEALREAGEEPA